LPSINTADALAKPVYLAALSVQVVMGMGQTLIPATDVAATTR